MVCLVPFDGSPLSEAALVRASQIDGFPFERVLAVTVIPRNNVAYARERGWLDAGDPFELDAVTDRLRAQVADASATADFEYETVDRHAPRGTIAKCLRRRVRDCSPSLIAIGSENAGRIATSLASIGGGMASVRTHDVLLVRNTVA
jgi:nucleotide-binding universal stress UspA family protein